MSNLINGIVYIIKSKSTNKVYIGSSSLSLDERKLYHYGTHPKSGPRGNTTKSKELLNTYDDCYFKILKQKENITRKELLAMEEHFINKPLYGGRLVNKNKTERGLRQFKSAAL